MKAQNVGKFNRITYMQSSVLIFGGKISCEEFRCRGIGPLSGHVDFASDRFIWADQQIQSLIYTFQCYYLTSPCFTLLKFEALTVG